MVNLALYWAEQYQEDHADVRISVTGGGSGTGISAMISNTVDIANASRVIKDEEIKAAIESVEPVEQLLPGCESCHCPPGYNRAAVYPAAGVPEIQAVAGDQCQELGERPPDRAPLHE